VPNPPPPVLERTFPVFAPIESAAEDAGMYTTEKISVKTRMVTPFILFAAALIDE
jgi:hypothetical protein